MANACRGLLDLYLIIRSIYRTDSAPHSSICGCMLYISHALLRKQVCDMAELHHRYVLNSIMTYATSYVSHALHMVCIYQIVSDIEFVIEYMRPE